MHIAPDAVVITNQRGGMRTFVIIFARLPAHFWTLSEQSVVPPDSAEFFEFTWELMIVFNREVTEIVDVRINVVDVVYSDKVSPCLRIEVRRKLTSK